MAELLKSMVFRIPEPLKNDFKVALLKNGVTHLQNTFEAFVEAVVDYDKGEKSEVIRNILKRAKSLTSGV